MKKLFLKIKKKKKILFKALNRKKLNQFIKKLFYI
jgi:hypothetical protein